MVSGLEVIFTISIENLNFNKNFCSIKIFIDKKYFFNDKFTINFTSEKNFFFHLKLLFFLFFFMI